jgi:hypothetical protein
MPIPTVWSERNDVVAGEHDCAYSSILMCLVYGGKTTYPLGEYTAAEREALERSDDRPDEQGASSDDIDTAISRRYGLAAHTPADLDALLRVRGTAVSVGGLLSNLPAGNTLRRYAPDYTGGHRVCVLPRGDGTVRWLDPLAPMNYGGDIAAISTVLLFSKGRTSIDARYVNQDEYINAQAGTGGGITLDMGLRLRVPSPAVAGTIDVKQGTPALRVSDGVANPNGLDTDATNRDAYAADVVNDDGSTHATGYVLNLTRSGVTEGWFVNHADIPLAAFTPNATGDTKHTVTVAVDGQTKATVMV